MNCKRIKVLYIGVCLVIRRTQSETRDTSQMTSNFHEYLPELWHYHLSSRLPPAPVFLSSDSHTGISTWIPHPVKILGQEYIKCRFKKKKKKKLFIFVVEFFNNIFVNSMSCIWRSKVIDTSYSNHSWQFFLFFGWKSTCTTFATLHKGEVNRYLAGIDSFKMLERCNGSYS